MCFSFEVSLSTGIVCWTIAILSLYYHTPSRRRETRLSAWFLLIFSAMQFFDAILWKIKFAETSLNYWVSSVAIPALLGLQLLFNAYTLHVSDQRRVSSSMVIGLYAAAVLMTLYIKLRLEGYSIASCNAFGSPVWTGHEITMPEMGLFILILLFPRWKVACLTILLVILLRYAFPGGGYGSLWCALSILYALRVVYGSTCDGENSSFVRYTQR